MTEIRVLIADDQAIVAEGLSALLSMEDDIDVLGIAENGLQALEFLSKNAVDVILMDIRMPEMNGVECTKEVCTDYPDTKVLILTTFDDDEYIMQAMNNGASGYMLKDLTADRLSAAIRNVHQGNAVLHKTISQKIISGFPGRKNNSAVFKTPGGEVLTKREKQVLSYLAKGYTNGEIAEELFLSVGTVKNYITLLYDKLNIKGRTKLMTFAIEKGLADTE